MKIKKQPDPFDGSIPYVIGFATKLKLKDTYDGEGVLGIMYNSKIISSLILPLVNDSISPITGEDEKIYHFIYDTDGSLLEEFDPEGVMNDDVFKAVMNPDVLNHTAVYSLYQSGDKIKISPADQTPSGVTVKHKVARTLSPINKNFTSLSQYDYVIVLIQDSENVDQYSDTINSNIYAEFYKLLVIVIGASIVLSCIIGFCVFRSTKRITSPIEKLTKLTQDIKKEHKIEEIRDKIKKHELF